MNRILAKWTIFHNTFLTKLDICLIIVSFFTFRRDSRCWRIIWIWVGYLRVWYLDTMIVYAIVIIRVGTECPSFLWIRGKLKSRFTFRTCGVIVTWDASFRTTFLLWCAFVANVLILARQTIPTRSTISIVQCFLLNQTFTCVHINAMCW